MKKIGIMTLYYGSNNYGGLLQAYALVNYINQNTEYRAEQISYRRMQKSMKEMLKCRSMTEFFFKVEQTFAIMYSLICNKSAYIEKDIGCRKELIAQFRNNIPHSEEVTDENIEELLTKYDAFIAGSDQIWNPYLYLSGYSLKFVPDGRKTIAYAASVGHSKLEKYQAEMMVPDIKKMDYISVREKTAEKLLKSYMPEKEVKTVVDPVLLLEPLEWDKVAKKMPINEPYIYAYFLGEDKKNYEYVKEISRIIGLPIVSVPYVRMDYNKYDEEFADIKMYDVGPSEFLGLIKNAELVVTDSFHAVTFAVIFQKKFFTFIRKRDKKSKDSRLIDALETYGLKDRLYCCNKKYEKEEILKEIDYRQTDDIIEKKRKESIEWLTAALNE